MSARNLNPVEASARARLVLHPAVALLGVTAFVVVASLWSEGVVRLLEQVSLPWLRAGSYWTYLLAAALASLVLLLVLAALRFPLVALV